MIEKALFFFLGMIALTLYFLPAIVGMARRHRNALPIFMTNLYMGWTFFGWAVAAIWSFSDNTYTLLPGQASVDAGAFHLNQAPARQSGRGMGVLHYVLIIGAVLIAAVAVLFIIAPQPAGKPSAEAPTVKTGVPMSADELFGTGSAPAADSAK